MNIEYVPFGEVFLEEKNAKWNTPYLFTSKELDRETGMYYFGARYQDPKLGIFISVDPLAEKFKGWSSYNYTLNNPLRFTDPDGRGPEPIKRILSSTIHGNVNPTSWEYSQKCNLCGGHGKTYLPQSNTSSRGYTLEYSKMQDDHPLIQDLLTEGKTTEFVHSVSSTITAVNAMYLDSNGNKVTNISDASSYSVTTQTTITTIDTYTNGDISQTANVSQTSSTQLFDVTKKEKGGYSLTSRKITNNKPILSLINSSKTDPKLQDNAKQAAVDNLIGASKDILDNLQKIPESQDRNFHESLKRL